MVRGGAEVIDEPGSERAVDTGAHLPGDGRQDFVAQIKRHPVGLAGLDLAVGVLHRRAYDHVAEHPPLRIWCQGRGQVGRARLVRRHLLQSAAERYVHLSRDVDVIPERAGHQDLVESIHGSLV